MISLHPVDLALIGFYLVATIMVGLRRSNREGGAAYLLAGRRLTLPVFVASLVSTWYGGILGVGEFSYLYGLSNWLVFGVPYYLFAALFALFLAGPARRSGYVSVPEQLEAAYGRRAGLLGALYLFIMTLPAPYLLMVAVLLTLITPLPFWLAVLLSAVFSFVYIFRNGLSAVVRTDALQFVLMFAGFAVLLGFLFWQYGGFDRLNEALPAQHLTWHGGNSLQYILVWYVIAMATLVDANFYQRCYAARTEKIARNGILVSILFWILFDFMTTTAGLYARALLPELQQPARAYPELAMLVLPPVALGLFFVALFATVMSTLDSFAFLAGQSIGRDFFARLRPGRPAGDERRQTRAGLAFALALSVVVVMLVDRVIDIWYALGSLVTPALLLPLATSFSRRWRMSARAAWLSMSLSGLSVLLWMLLRHLGWPPSLTVEPIFIGLLVSLLIVLSHSRGELAGGRW